MPNTLKQNVDRVVAAKTAISNAIVAQGGTVSVGDGLEEFAADIATIPTGVDPEPINAVLEDANDELEAALGSGGSTPVAKGQVNFYDYDGTLVKSMSSAQFRGLESMPANPSHEGLTAQGWNWSLSDAKTYVAANGSLNIGQQYVTDDGKTRIYVNLPEGKISPVLKLYLNENTELDIDWGDDSTHSAWTTTSAAYKSERHTYPDNGEYVIAITVVSGSFIFKSSSTSYNMFFTDGKNSTTSSDRAYLNSIQKIEIGTGVTAIQSSAFSYCTLLSSITIPNTVTTIANNSFSTCYSLSSITIPNTVTTIGTYAFSNCYSLSSITIPNGVTTIQGNAFSNCNSMDYIRFISTTPPTVQSSTAWSSVSASTIIYVPALVSNLYMDGTNYPSKSSYKYIGYATYESGTALPTTTTDETYTLTWYATSADAIAQTNPITQGTGNEVYSRATPVA